MIIQLMGTAYKSPKKFEQKNTQPSKSQLGS